MREQDWTPTARVCFVAGFAVFVSFSIGLLSLPMCWGYAIASTEDEAESACALLILCLLIASGLRVFEGRFASELMGGRIIRGVLVGSTGVFSLLHGASVISNGSFAAPSLINVLLFGLMTAMLFAAWGKVASQLSARQLYLDVPLALLLSSVVGTGLAWATVRVGLVEGSLYVLMPAVSVAFLWPLLRRAAQGGEAPVANFSTVAMVRTPEFAIFILLAVYVICTSVFYSVLTRGMLEYSLQGGNHRFAGFVALLVLFLLMQLARKTDRALPYGVVFFVTGCIAVLYCVSLFGIIDFQAARTLLLLTRALALFISLIVVVQIACRDGCRITTLFSFVLLPALLLSRALMFGAWNVLCLAPSTATLDGIVMALALASSFILTIGCFLLMFLWGKEQARQAREFEGRSSEIARDSGRALSEEEAIVLIQATYGLSMREAEVIMYIAQGNTRKAIAKMLFLSENSIATYSKSAYSKMGIHSRQEAIDCVKQLLSEASAVKD